MSTVVHAISVCILPKQRLCITAFHLDWGELPSWSPRTWRKQPGEDSWTAQPGHDKHLLKCSGFQDVTEFSERLWVRPCPSVCASARSTFSERARPHCNNVFRCQCWMVWDPANPHIRFHRRSLLSIHLETARDGWMVRRRATIRTLFRLIRNRITVTRYIASLYHEYQYQTTTLLNILLR